MHFKMLYEIQVEFFNNRTQNKITLVKNKYFNKFNCLGIWLEIYNFDIVLWNSYHTKFDEEALIARAILQHRQTVLSQLP